MTWFVIWTDRWGTAWLCEGGVYALESAARKERAEYVREFGPNYAVRTSLEGVRVEPDARSSLTEEQLKGIV